MRKNKKFETNKIKMDKLNTILQNNKYTDTVNSRDIEINNTVNSNEESLLQKISKFIEEQKITPEGIALLISELLADNKSLKYYLLLVKEHNPSVLIELAYQVRDRHKLGLLKRAMPIYFIGILRKKGFKTKFR